MRATFDEFTALCAVRRPRVGIVFGSGLAAAARALEVEATLAYADVPGLAPPSVAGHRGEAVLGRWAGVPVVACLGRLHFYEGHPWPRVTRLVHLLAAWGVGRVILTNAAGGIADGLNPGDLMLIRAHLPLLGPDAWRTLEPVATPYTPHLLARLPSPRGVYAALTGPAYETHAEIRALKALGADAVGMSTAREAEAAAALGLEVVGVSCITNKAAGLSAGALSHHDVEAVAATAAGRLAALVEAALA